jgi:arylsulfatase A-like enzyme
MQSRRRILAAACVGIVSGALGACAPEEQHWNVLVLAPDTIRADRLSTNGYPRETTPVLDRLAAEGANFRQAITAAPRTWQSFASIFTGLYPPRHGVRYIFDRPLAPDVPTLASILVRHGWEAAAFEAGSFMEEISGGAGFQHFFRPQSGGGPAALAEALDWLSRPGPRFAFVWLSGAHWPYHRNRWTAEFESCEGKDHRFNTGHYGVARGEAGFEVEDEDALRRMLWTVSPELLPHMTVHYDAEVRQTDAWIGGLIDPMRESGLLERTVVAVTSDHGESLGEHGYLQHGPRVDDAVMRVPFLLRLPGDHPAARPGLVVDELVRTVDLMPTLLELVGVSPPPGLDGISLVPALRGERLPQLWAYGESGRSFREVDPQRHLQGVPGKHRMIRTADWKLVFVPDEQGGQSRLYDLRADPGESRDVAAEAPDVLTSLRGHLDSILAGEAGRPLDAPLSPEQRERLRALGYVD